MTFVSLKFKLITLSLLVSLLLTGLISVIEIKRDNSRHAASIAAEFARFEERDLASITSGMWLMDYRSVASSVRTYLDHTVFDHIVIADVRGEIIFDERASRDRKATVETSRTYRLTQEHNGRQVEIGSLQLSAAAPRLLESLRNHLAEMLVINGILVGIIFGSSYLFLYRGVLGSLHRLTRFTETMDFDSGRAPALLPESTPRFADEITVLTEAINDMGRRIGSELDKRTRAERELREREHRHRIIFENNPLGVIRMDREGVIRDCNDKFVELMGSSREKLLGFNGAHHSSPKMRAAIRQALGGEMAVYEDRYTSITGGRTTDLRVVYNPVNPGRPPTDVIATVEDISDRKRAEEAIRASAERFRAIFSSVNDAIFVHPYVENGYATFIEVNDIACSRYGYTREELLHLSALDINPDLAQGRLPVAGFRQRLLKSGRQVFETIHATKNGERFPVEVSSSVMEQDGRPVFLSVARDISERRNAREEKFRLEAQLRQAQKLESVGRLAGGVAHDFNNMLSVILGYTELALGEIEPSSPLHAKLEQIRQAGEHSANLTRQLLAFARKQTIAPQVLDLNGVIGDMFGMLRRLIGEDIRFDWRPAGELWPVKVDPVQIHQILANLSLNARDALAGAGTITITTENVVVDESEGPGQGEVPPGAYVVFSVADDGRGMEEEALEHIFEPFFTTKKPGEGTGLGLATVYGIMTQNQGFVTVVSTPGAGTLFRNFLPRFEGEAPVGADARQEPVVGAAGRETILLVEDEAAILAMVSAMLKRQGYQVVAAASPIEAERLARSCGAIDLLVTDVIMPEMNGRELADRLTAQHPQLRCLFMSGYTAEVIAEHGVLEDGIEFIQKPFSQHLLAARVRSLLAGIGTEKTTG